MYATFMEKEMATHSSILAWRIPGTEEPGGLPFLGSHRVRHDWSNLAAAAVYLDNGILFSNQKEHTSAMWNNMMSCTSYKWNNTICTLAYFDQCNDFGLYARIARVCLQQFQVYSKVIQLYMYLFFFKFCFCLGCYITLNGVPCAPQVVLVGNPS